MKDRMGTGDWLRGQTEHCIMAVRGKPIVQLTNQTTALVGPMRANSQKPEEFYEFVEKLCPAPLYAELFSRQPRKNWDGHGDESGPRPEVEARMKPSPTEPDTGRAIRKLTEIEQGMPDMTENIAKFPEPGSREDYFGVCPICQRQNGYLNDGRDHWFVCNTHMTKWLVGSNLFSSWRHLTKEESFAQVDQLTRYREVKEFHPEKPNIVPVPAGARFIDDDVPF
jgi:hypothetical protein